MIEGKSETILLDENINNIFERKIEVGAVIQFNLLQRLIEEFIKRHKSINDKVNNLEIKVNTLESMSIEPVVINPNTSKYLDESNINFETQKDFNKKEKTKDKGNDLEKPEIKEKEKGTEKEKEKENKNIDEINVVNINNNEEQNKIKENNIKNENKGQESDSKVKDIKMSDKVESPDLNNQYKKLEERMDKVEILVKELNKKLLNSSLEGKVNIQQIKTDVGGLKRFDDKIRTMEKNILKINQFLKELKEYNNKLQFFQKENEKKKEETDDNKNNILDNIKLENLPIIKVLTKKIEYNETKNKEYDEDLIKIKNEIQNISSAIDLNKNKYNEFVKESYSNINELRMKNSNDIDSLKNYILENSYSIKKELDENIEQSSKKLKDMIIELSENSKNNNNSGPNTNTNYIAAAKVNNEKLNHMNMELKNYINKSTSDTEKYLKSIINNLGIDNIKKELSGLHEELNDKLSKPDLDYVDLKFTEFETKLNNQDVKIEMARKDVNLCNDSCAKTVKMVEYLSGQVVQAYQPDLEQAQKEEMAKKLNSVNAKDLESFLNRNEFDKEIQNIYKKIEQTLEVESENYKFIQHIESRLKLFATQKELSHMDQCIMNLIEELKNEMMRKFMEKSEISKNFKTIEMQIKNIYETCPNLSHIKEGDNWLLAKKHMNNYLCASCESYLGDIKNKNIYLPWNKISSHDSKKYRMGNGFSRMLQLVNFDLMRNAEKINNNLTIKIDDKKTNQELLKQLPRIGSQISMRHLNHPNSTFSLINNENVENRLNNSADGLENIEEINNNNYSSNNNNQEIEIQEKIIGKNNDKENSPKVIKIVKKPKIEKK